MIVGYTLYWSQAQYVCEAVLREEKKTTWYFRSARFACALCLLVLLPMPSPADAQNTDAFTALLIERTVKQVYQPRHRTFAQSAEQFLHVTQRSCQHRSADALSKLRDEFSLLVVAFSSIELYRVGPILEENRQNRLFFWPDKRRAGERQLRALLADTSRIDLIGEQLHDKSVALQGLPAVERLLFGKSAMVRIGTESAAPDCQVMIAIAQNISTMAAAMNAGWSNSSAFVKGLYYPHEESYYYRTVNEVLRSIVTQIIVGIDVVLNRKIASLTGADARWTKAPLWLSEQTMAMIRSNLDSLRVLIVDSGLAKRTDLHNELSFEFRTADTMLQSLLDLPRMIDDSGHLNEKAQSLIRSLAAVTGGIALTLNDRFVQTLGISAGFNSEDGD